MLIVDEIQARLKARFYLPEWIYISEVRNSTGYIRDTTYADGLAVNLYPSKNCEILGFEIKVSRNDVLKELGNLKKSENIQQYCDRWWLVVGDKSIVSIAELPPYWGLMIPYGQGLRQVRAAPLQKTVKLFTRGFLASLFRKIYVDSPTKTQLNAEYKRGREDGKAQSQLPQQHLIENAKEIQEQVERFEKISGIDINQYRGGRELGEAVKIIQSATRIGTHIRDLEATEKEHRRIADAAKTATENLRKLANQK